MAASSFRTRTVRVALVLALCAGTATLASERPATAAPQGQSPIWDWNWGELLYGGSYTTTLTVDNHCKSPQGVEFRVSDPYFEKLEFPGGGAKPIKKLQWVQPPPSSDARVGMDVKGGETLPLSARAMLSIPKPGCKPVPFGSAGSKSPTLCSAVVPPGATEFEVTITTPPPPDLSKLILPPGFNPSSLFNEVSGVLEITSKGKPPECMPSREVYLPGGHVHLDPNPKGKSDGGPRCRDWWDKEEKPRGLTRDCTGEIRDLALTYLRTSLQPLVEKNPAAWSWLPTPEQILKMSIEELIAMKVRSRATARGRD